MKRTRSAKTLQQAIGLLLAAGGLATLRPATAQPAGRTWYVDAAHGDDARDGSSETRAFRSLGRALSSRSGLRPRDTIRVKARLYRERVKTDRGGAPGRPVRI